MKLILLQLAALSAAFILPNEQVSYLQHVETRTSRALDSALSSIPTKSEAIEYAKDSFDHVSDKFEAAFDSAMCDMHKKYLNLANKFQENLDEAISSTQKFESNLEQEIENVYSKAQEQSRSAVNNLEEMYSHDLETLRGHKPNKTVYQLISENKHTQKLAKLIGEYDDLVETLNGTAANYTLFAPTDKVLEHIHHKHSKDVIKKVLLYHISPEFYPMKEILFSRTIPTLLKLSSLGKNKPPLRLSTRFGWKGVTINFLSSIVGFNKFATNGVLHLVDGLFVPVFPIAYTIDRHPSAFSTLELGLVKTKLFDDLNSTKSAGGTLFAPNNAAFAKLGDKTNSFLFSEQGLKYLKALLNYHICPKNTLFSDAFYKKSSNEVETIPLGTFHVDLPTQLDDRNLSIDIARVGRIIEISINAYNRVAVSDVIADDGVIHVLDRILIPPKKLSNGEWEEWNGKDEISVDELKEILEPFVNEADTRFEEL